ncbi:MAG: electron transfer flavoprotein subunit alpha/FixB family protein [Candidatus Marinimicrobia bacterium]|nr:electron transfer flavoprotein subunit alpha/FixB family protein [Candidatus Neomarinimicrobiota bacterium]MCF7851350.1 electron transfer flavoprotein subunit alpha/FixB family protein [Candidatus Neomarinimicrobiota bacterium]MCF7905172.1 electron transfer flavoprotein subunit alpha/FixB family protein [Candidatus Neomarinimicrobiota bacterium]
MSKNIKDTVWVFAEQTNGQLADVSLELMHKAGTLAEKMDSGVSAVLLGHKVGSLAKILYAHGADNVYLLDDEELEEFRSQPYANLITRLVEKKRPRVVLFGATHIGRDIAPRVASHTRSGLTADCTELKVETLTIKKIEHPDLLLQIRPAFGGNIVATIISPDVEIQMATVREGVMEMGEPDTTRKGKLIQVPVELDAVETAVRIIEKHQEDSAVNLKSAPIIVAGGYGADTPEKFNLIKELAKVLGAEVAGSRAAVDAGLIDVERQVGQTGTTVRPKLYIAIGISGAIQHRAGMQESQKIIAINSDPDAPIFSVAHYGICGKLEEVIPKLIAAYKSQLH